MRVRRVRSAGKLKCSACGQQVLHVVFVHDAPDGPQKVLVPAKTHLAPCGLLCAAAADTRQPTSKDHGYEGACPKCTMSVAKSPELAPAPEPPKPAPEPEPEPAPALARRRRGGFVGR